MITVWQAIALGIVQGLTEFLPISSSAHLVLMPWLLDWPSPGLAFDAVLHLGTLLAVLVFFRAEWGPLLRGFLWTLRPGGPPDPMGRLAWLLILGTMPAGLTGLLLEEVVARLFEGPLVIGLTLPLTTLALVLGERRSSRAALTVAPTATAALAPAAVRDLSHLRARDALLIGLAQAGAILPGLSRSGLTIVAGLLVGLSRPAAARFSFLLSAPVILGAGGLEIVKLLRTDPAALNLTLLSGFLAAGLAGYLTIAVFLGYLRRYSLYPFALYCLTLGLITLGLMAVRAGG